MTAQPFDFGALAARLDDYFGSSQRLFALTGAGCSTGSGLPEYRDTKGEWKHARPVMHQDFVASAAVRRRYWARSSVGWTRFSNAKPNRAHHALAHLEKQGHLSSLVTQNVDGLHQQAGSTRVIDIHGRLDRVVCLQCDIEILRSDLQTELLRLNPQLRQFEGSLKPDGDSAIPPAVEESYEVPECQRCGGVLKPDVVFFGDSVPKDKVNDAMANMLAADGVLVVGSSLMVYSGYRFVRAALAAGQPVAIINLGHTRADAEVGLKLDAPCEPLLDAYASLLCDTPNDA